MKQNETIDFHIRWAWHKISRFYNAEASKKGFSMSIGYVLLNIDLNEGTPATKLGPKMGIEARSLTRTLKSMEEKGLICKIPDKADKRVIRIKLTDKGIELRNISRKTVIDLNNKLKKALGEENINDFLNTIHSINNLIPSLN